MKITTIRSLIDKRANTDDHFHEEVERCWDELSDALVTDVDLTRRFLLVECTPDEAIWVSEIYEEIIEKTQSLEFIEILRACIDRFPEENALHNMSRSLDLALSQKL